MRRFFGSVAAVAAALVLAQPGSAFGQDIRNYNVRRAPNPIVADGIVSPGEWDAASPAAGDFRELRNAFDDVDTDNNRFRVLFDDDNLYILHESDYDAGWLPRLGDDNPVIAFNDENINFYIDPNRDGDLNTGPGGFPLPPGVADDANVDGYQVSFNQYLGAHVSTDGDRDGIGFFTEAHVDSPFGDLANWNQGGGSAEGAALGGITVAQNNLNGPDAGGVIEIVFPFADLDADGFITDDQGQMTSTGLNATDGAKVGEVWGFNVALITEDPDNFLPIWNWHDAQFFAAWPHGTLTFVPEPCAASLAVFAMAFNARRRIGKQSE